MNIVKKYFEVKNKPVLSGSEMARKLNVSSTFICKLRSGDAILPRRIKLDFYVISYDSLPVAAQRYVIRDVTNDLEDMEREVNRLVAAMKAWK